MEHGPAWQGKARLGAAGRGLAGNAAWYGVARQGEVGRGVVWQGTGGCIANIYWAEVSNL